MKLNFSTSANSGIQFHRISDRDPMMIKSPDNHAAIVLLSKGIVSINGKNGLHRMIEGGGYMMKCFTNYFITGLDDRPFDGIVCFVEPAILFKIACALEPKFPQSNEIFSRENIFLPASQKLDCFMESLMLYLPLVKDSDNLQIIFESKLQEFFWLLKQTLHPNLLTAFLQSVDRPEKLAFDSLLETYYKENISLSELSELAGCSISTFKRKFVKLYNTTPGKWIKARRLEEARDLVRTSGKTISEICFEVGFESPSHFIHTFKSKFGITPKQLQYSVRAA